MPVTKHDNFRIIKATFNLVKKHELKNKVNNTSFRPQRAKMKLNVI